MLEVFMQLLLPSLYSRRDTSTKESTKTPHSAICVSQKRRLTYSQRRSEGHKKSWVLSWCSSRAWETAGCSLFQGMAQPYLRSQINRWSPTTISQSLNPTTSSIKLLLIPNYSYVFKCVYVCISRQTEVLKVGTAIGHQHWALPISSPEKSLKAKIRRTKDP